MEKVIKKILSCNKMKVAKVEFNKSNGGSIRCYVVKEINSSFGSLKDRNKVRRNN